MSSQFIAINFAKSLYSIVPKYHLYGKADANVLGFWDKLVSSFPDGPGEGGKAVVLSPREEKLAKERFKENQFNVVASEKISPNRTLPDYRNSQ